MFELWKLHRSRDKALKEIKNKLDEAKKTKDKERVQELLYEEQSVIDEFSEWEAYFKKYQADLQANARGKQRC